MEFDAVEPRMARIFADQSQAVLLAKMLFLIRVHPRS
jgi:hypothetical protein